MSKLFVLEVVDDQQRKLAAGWLKLGIYALLASGIFSLLLVTSRTPGVQAYIPFLDFFHTALVVHVVLSVVIWFIAFSSVLWVLANHRINAFLDKIILGVTALGTVIIVVSPFTGDGNPLLNNYVPVLQQTTFMVGLCTFGVGYLLLILRSLFALMPIKGNPLRFAIYASVIIAFLSLASLLFSYLAIPASFVGQTYYELLFWSGGHTLQFAHALLLIVCWIWLAEAIGCTVPISNKLLLLLIGLMLLPALFAPVIHMRFDVVSPEFRQAFTELMRWGGLSSLPLGLIVGYMLMRKGKVALEHRHLRNTLYASIFLFTAGGIIGFLIQGINVVIPAHYHGSIVGVTLAFMGITYYLLPKLGFQQPSLKLARMQPLIYAAGQFMHILGLAWSGGYGVQRKTAGAAQGLDNLPQVLGMGMMGLGGLISIIGGGLFLYIVLVSMYGKNKDAGSS